MPNLYNRPRWTLGRLVTTIRYRSSIPGLFLLAVTCLYLLGGIFLPESLTAHWAPLEAPGLSWRVRGLALTATPLLRLLEFLGQGASREAGILLLQALAAGGTVALTVRFLGLAGLSEVTSLKVGLLLSLSTCLGVASWQLGPEVLLALSVAGLLLFGWSFRQGGRPRDAFSALGCLLAGSFLDPRLLLVLPVLATWSLPASLRPRIRLLQALSLLALFLGTWLHTHFLLRPEEIAYVLSHLTVGQILRRLLAATAGAGSSLLLAIPLTLVALPGLRSFFEQDRPLARLVLGVGFTLGLARLILVQDMHEASVPLLGFAPLLPTLAPVLAHGLHVLQEHRQGKALILATAMLGTAFQVQSQLVDGGFLLQALEAGGYDYPLDRSFTPELSRSLLDFQCLVGHLRGVRHLNLWLPQVHGIPGRNPIQVDITSLTPRPWPLRLARWTPPEGQKQVLQIPGGISLGSRSLWIQTFGALTYASLLGLLLLCGISLQERHRKLREILQAEEEFPGGEIQRGSFP
jgi:hypothetical protein